MKDGIEDMDLTNEVSPQDDVGASQDVEKPATESSSASTDVSNTVADDDLLAVARSAVDDTVKPAAEASSANANDGPKADDISTQPDDENFSDVPFNKHPRFQQLLAKTKAFEQDAGRYRNVQTFLDSNGLAAEEAADGLEVMALAKSNPTEAWERLKPFAEKVARAAGVILPDELIQKVQAGEMSAEAAAQLSRANARAENIGAQRTFEQRIAAQREQDTLVTAVRGAAHAWETDRLAKDPNFAAKLPALQREVLWLQQQEGKPGTPEGVKTQLEKAYRAVNETHRPAAPSPAAPKPVTMIRGGQGSSVAQPTTSGKTIDIIKSVVAQRRSA